MKNIEMREAYLKVLGQYQEPVQEAKKMGRPSWVPESIKDGAVSDFMSALVAAHKEGKETFSFSEKNYKMSFSKKKGMAEGMAGMDDAVPYTVGGAVDKQYVYTIMRDGKSTGTYNSLEDAKRVVASGKKRLNPSKFNIVRKPRTKMAGPKGKLPEGMAEEVKEGSEWETRHDEFVTVGNRATPQQINKIINALDDAAKRATEKRGVVNSIFGKQSNGDLARKAFGAQVLSKSLQRNRNSKPDTEERKELGQHLVYAVSLMKEGMEESVVIDTDDSKVDQGDECEKCGEVHEGECATKKEELSPKQKKIDHDKDGDIDGKDLAKLRMRKEAAEITQFAADLAENGFDQDEIDSILSKIDEAQGHVGTGGPAAAPAEELGDTLPDGELDFIEMHDIEITDLTPEDPEHSANIKKATPPVTKGIGTAEVDGQKIVASKPEVAVKSQAAVPKTK
jgi:hypothetical protein